MVNKPDHQTFLPFLIQEQVMEKALKDLGEDDLELAILATLLRVLFLILILFKILSFSIIKEYCFLKVNLSRCPRAFFERKIKRLGLLSSHRRSPGDKVLIF